MSTKLIDICLSSPTAVIRALKDLEDLGYDINSLLQTDMIDSDLVDLRDKSYLFRCIDLPAEDKTDVRKYGD